MEGNTGQNVIGSYHKVHYIEFACILSYRPGGGGGGLLPYITYTGMCRPTGS